MEKALCAPDFTWRGDSLIFTCCFLPVIPAVKHNGVKRPGAQRSRYTLEYQSYKESARVSDFFVCDDERLPGRKNLAILSGWLVVWILQEHSQLTRVLQSHQARSTRIYPNVPGIMLAGVARFAR